MEIPKEEILITKNKQKLLPSFVSKKYKFKKQEDSIK